MLYIVATPIGNLDEMSFRAIEILKNVDIIAAEDTRRSGILLTHFDIKTPVISYYKYIEKKITDKLIEKLKSGLDIALISDAGMPLISDPGAVLLDECIKNGIDYTVVSGPCALINAVVLSGLDCSNFVMLGFLPDKISERKKLIMPYVFVPATLVFYCPPQSIEKDLEFLYSVLKNRRFALVKEISKIHETVIRGELGKPLDNINIKGEFVLVVEGYRQAKEERSVTELVEEYLSMGLSKMEAIKAASKDKQIPKSEVYRLINKGD